MWIRLSFCWQLHFVRSLHKTLLYKAGGYSQLPPMKWCPTPAYGLRLVKSSKLDDWEVILVLKYLLLRIMITCFPDLSIFMRTIGSAFKIWLMTILWPCRRYSWPMGWRLFFRPGKSTRSRWRTCGSRSTGASDLVPAYWVQAPIMVLQPPTRTMILQRKTSTNGSIFGQKMGRGDSKPKTLQYRIYKPSLSEPISLASLLPAIWTQGSKVLWTLSKLLRWGSTG